MASKAWDTSNLAPFSSVPFSDIRRPVIVLPLRSTEDRGVPMNDDDVRSELCIFSLLQLIPEKDESIKFEKVIDTPFKTELSNVTYRAWHDLNSVSRILDDTKMEPLIMHSSKMHLSIREFSKDEEKRHPSNITE